MALGIFYLQGIADLDQNASRVIILGWDSVNYPY